MFEAQRAIALIRRQVVADPVVASLMMDASHHEPGSDYRRRLDAETDLSEHEYSPWE